MNVLFDSQCLAGSIDFRTSEVVVSALNELMGVKEGNVVFKVRQATLDEILKARLENDGALRIADLVSKLSDSIMNKNDKDAALNLIEAYNNTEKNSTETSMRIFLVENCVVEPKLSNSDVVKLAKYYPAAITKIVDEIFKLTDIGGIKKNL